VSKAIKKKTLLLPLILLLTISALNMNMTSVSAAESPYIAVVPPTTTGPGIDESFMVSINTDYSGSDVWGWQFTLSYDPTIIQGASVTNGDLIHPDKSIYAMFEPGEFDNEAGKLSLTLAYFYFQPPYVPPTNTSGPGTLANITFTVVGIGTSDITLGPETKLKAVDHDIIDAVLDPNHIRHGYFDNTGIPPIYENPVASFTWTPTTPEANETVTFDASASYDPDGIIVSYEWDFDDGNTDTGVVVNNAYALEGDYTVKLTVTDYQGLTDDATATFEVTLPPPPGTVDLVKWKVKPEHHHFDISRELARGEDDICEITALVGNTREVDFEVTVEFVIIDQATGLIVGTLDVTDTVESGTQKPLTTTAWTPTPGKYLISVTGTYAEGITSTKVTKVSVVD